MRFAAGWTPESTMPGKILTEDPDRIDRYIYIYISNIQTCRTNAHVKTIENIQDNTCTCPEGS